MEENLEQPSADTTDVSEQIENNERGEMPAEGSTFGKFKDATSLLEAYSSLEKEFTRKAQKLSELKKAYEDLSGKKSQNEDKNSEKQVLNAQNEQNFENETEKTVDRNQPKYLGKDWPSKVRQFIKDNPDAGEYKAEIAKILMNDRYIAENSNCLEYAFALAKNKRPAAKTAPKITEQDKAEIIREYLTSLKSGKTNPRFISGEATSSALTPNQDKPKTIREASNILQKLLQK